MLYGLKLYAVWPEALCCMVRSFVLYGLKLYAVLSEALCCTGCPVQFGTKYIFWASKDRKFMSKKWYKNRKLLA